MGTTQQKSSCRNRLQNGLRLLSQAKVGIHTRLSEKDRTQRHTRRKRGRFGWGWYHYPRTVPHVHEYSRAGCQNGVLCRFWVLAGCTSEERRKPSEQRCAYARRCSEGVAAPPGCVALLPLFVQHDLLGWKDLTKRSGRVTITRNNRTASRLALVWEPHRAVK